VDFGATTSSLCFRFGGICPCAASTVARPKQLGPTRRFSDVFFSEDHHQMCQKMDVHARGALHDVRDTRRP
jgi:hypothetical protein